MDNRQVLAAILVARAKPLPEPEQGEVALLRRLLLRRRLLRRLLRSRSRAATESWGLELSSGVRCDYSLRLLLFLLQGLRRSRLWLWAAATSAS
jgi:hypothetical protein